MSLSQILRAVADELDRNGGNVEAVVKKIETPEPNRRERTLPKPMSHTQYNRAWAKQVAHKAIYGY